MRSCGTCTRFVREVRLTEREFQAGDRLVNAIGQQHHAEPQRGDAAGRRARRVEPGVPAEQRRAAVRAPTQANNLGPFWRAGAPRVRERRLAAALADAGRGAVLQGLGARRRRTSRSPGAEVDVWHSSPVGLYENQDPTQAEMNLRGTFTTARRRLVRVPQRQARGLPGADRRPGRRAARARRSATTCARRTCTSSSTSRASRPSPRRSTTNDDPYLETDSQFGVTKALIGNYVKHQGEPAPAPGVAGTWWSLEHVFVIEPGEARRPQPPITQKVGSAA